MVEQIKIYVYMNVQIDFEKKTRGRLSLNSLF